MFLDAAFVVVAELHAARQSRDGTAAGVSAGVPT